jgi:hypothetical protein
MKKIPFDIKYRPEIESGKYKVQTRDGRNVRILTFTYPSEHLIQAEVDKRCVLYNPTGMWWDDGSESELDLFIITDEPELTEFEEELRRIIVATLSGETPDGSGGTMSWAVDLSDDDVRKLAPKVMELAKKDLYKILDKNMKDEFERGRLQGFGEGYQKATEEHNKSVAYHFPTYGPPCHHGGICTNPFKDCINCPITGGDIGIYTTTLGTCKKED